MNSAQLLQLNLPLWQKPPKARASALLGALSCLICDLSQAATTELIVVGKPVLEAQLKITGDKLPQVTGRLTDETGKPLAGQIQVFHAPNRKVLRIQPCAEAGQPPSRSLSTSDNGEFCVLLADEAAQVTVQASAQHFLPLNVELRDAGNVVLPQPRFSQVPQLIDVGGKDFSVAEVLASSGSRNQVAGAQLSLVLSCDAGRRLIKKVAISQSRLIRFEFKVDDATPPGNCRLVAQASAPGHESKQDERNVLLRGRAHLRVLSQVEQKSSLQLKFEVSSAGKPLDQGVVEASDQGAHLVTAALSRGRSALTIARSGRSRRVSIRYLPASPAYIADSPIEMDIQPTKAGAGFLALHWLGLSAFFFWLAFAWLRPRYQKSASPRRLPKKPTVSTVRHSKGPIFGEVLDAHTGEPIGSATVRLSEVAAQGTRTLHEVTSGADGKFRFNAKYATGQQLRLSATTSSHMSLSSPVHAAGLTLHLVERRRALVQRLGDWAKSQGSPWHRRPTATPGNVAALAQSLKDERRATWAAKVNAAAYGRTAPSEDVVEALRQPAITSPPEKTNRPTR